MPKDSKDQATAKEFLKVLGSVEGQDVFNPLKGSIPARVDADVSKYDILWENDDRRFQKEQADSKYGTRLSSA